MRETTFLRYSLSFGLKSAIVARFVFFVIIYNYMRSPSVLYLQSIVVYVHWNKKNVNIWTNLYLSTLMLYSIYRALSSYKINIFHKTIKYFVFNEEFRRAKYIWNSTDYIFWRKCYYTKRQRNTANICKHDRYETDICWGQPRCPGNSHSFDPKDMNKHTEYNEQYLKRVVFTFIIILAVYVDYIMK